MTSSNVPRSGLMTVAIVGVALGAMGVSFAASLNDSEADARRAAAVKT